MKRLTALLLAVLLLAALCACGGAGKEIDLNALASQLTASDAFSDTLSQPPEGVASRLYDFADGDVKQCVLYTGSGATAEEIFLAEAADASAAAALKTACEERIADQQSVFANYAPEEVAKLEGAVLITSGNYVLLAVAADASAARTILESAG